MNQDNMRRVVSVIPERVSIPVPIAIVLSTASKSTGLLSSSASFSMKKQSAELHGSSTS
jgi:hypothetical protein